MLTTIPAYVVYIAENSQQAASSKRVQAKRGRPPKASDPKQDGHTSAKNVCMETVQEEVDDYVVL